MTGGPLAGLRGFGEGGGEVGMGWDEQGKVGGGDEVSADMV